MNEDVMSEYVKNSYNIILQYFRMILGKSYNFNIVKTFVNKYISVRYYNDTLYPREKNIVTKISKELKMVAKELINENPKSIELIKNITALFGYIMYFDDCIPCDNINKVVKTLFNDTNIKLEIEEDTKNNLYNVIKENNDKKKKFLSLFDTKEFELTYKRVGFHYFKVDVKQYCNISKLYSDYAINTAFNTGTVYEDKIYLIMVMLSYKVLVDAINLNFKNKYIVEFPISVLNKTKKRDKFLKIIDNEYLKSVISYSINYRDYLLNQELINSMITSGFSMSVILDDSFKMDIDSLILFNCVIISKDIDYYDNFMDLKDEIKIDIISI